MGNTDRWLIIVALVSLYALTFANSYVIWEQQTIVEACLDMAAEDSELIVNHNAKLWDLHYRVLALEAEDERLLAHIKWFVMRRSGTDELRKMEVAVARLEAAQ